MGKDKKHQREEFSGEIVMISVSPHGDPEGLVLESGDFIKIPPHSLVAKDAIAIGVKVSGSGERLDQGPNVAYHHVQLKVGKQIVSDDSLDPKKTDELKERHKAENKKREDVESKKVKFVGTPIAFGSKPKGEIDRILFDDGTSVHVPKDVELKSDEFEVGAEVEITGEEKRFGDLRFIKAESVQPRA